MGPRGPRPGPRQDSHADQGLEQIVRERGAPHGGQRRQPGVEAGPRQAPEDGEGVAEREGRGSQGDAGLAKHAQGRQHRAPVQLHQDHRHQVGGDAER